MPDAKTLKMLRKKWGVPNWKNDADYDYASNAYFMPLINDQLRWEFVRRLPEYRENWEDNEFCRLEFNLIEKINPSLRGDKLQGRSVLFIDTVLRGGLVSTALSSQPPEDEEDLCKYVGKFMLQLENDGFLILGFDPAFPERPQIERADKILKHYRKELIRSKEIIIRRATPIENPSQLLRALDAHNEGVSDLEIGQYIYGIKDLKETHADTVAHARSVGSDRVKAAKSCWQRAIPTKKNALL